MSRLTNIYSSKLSIISLVVVFILLGLGIGLWAHDSRADQVRFVTNYQHQLTQISYHGQTGENAFILLQEHARVGYKHYSFGNFVRSIDGVVGDGPKYWTLYVNNRQSAVGASDYQTKNTDTITWKLQ